jgi:hypothetical protein
VASAQLLAHTHRQLTLSAPLSQEPPFTVQRDSLLNSSTPNAALGPSPYERRWHATDDASNGTAFSIWEHMGNTSPYASSKLFPDAQRFQDLPPTCAVSGVHILHRHGARFPTSSTSGERARACVLQHPASVSN